MRDFNNFRLTNDREIRIINTSLNQISSDLELFIEKQKLSLYISVSENDEKRLIFLIPETLLNLILNIRDKSNINSAGLYFGFVRRNTFFLSLEGAEFFFNKNIIPEQNILNVKYKGEKAILYGNPILKRMIFTIPSNMKKNAVLVVFNENKEVIALARSEVDSSGFNLLNEGDLVAINLIDKGYYLRRKQ